VGGVERLAVVQLQVGRQCEHEETIDLGDQRWPSIEVCTVKAGKMRGLDKIQCKYLYIVLGSCYSGALIDDLMEENRIIYTSSNKTETAKASEFRSDFMWASYAALEPFPFFGRRTECAAAADKNSDGRVSLLEMFNFAEKFVLDKRLTQHPQRWVGSQIGSDSDHYIGEGSYLYYS